MGRQFCFEFPKIVFFTFLITVLFFSSYVFAVSLGNIPPKRKLIFIRPGNAVKIPLVFFTTDKNDVILGLSLESKIYSNEYGKDLYINFVDSKGNVINSIVLPGGTVTTSPSGKGHGPWIVIPGTNKYVEARVVYLSIYAPNKPVFFKNIYIINVLAKTQPEFEEIKGESTKISQEREYHFTIRILNAKTVPQVYLPSQHQTTISSFLTKTKESVQSYMKNFFKILKNGINKIKNKKKTSVTNGEKKTSNNTVIGNSNTRTISQNYEESKTTRSYSNGSNSGLNSMNTENVKGKGNNKISGKAIERHSGKKINRTTIIILVAGTIFLIILVKS